VAPTTCCSSPTRAALRSVRAYARHEDSAEDRERALDASAVAANYHAVESDGLFGIELRAKDGTILANDRTRYDTAAGRDAALEEWQVHADLKKIEVVPLSITAYVFEVTGYDRSTLLRSVKLWTTEQGAEEAYRTVFTPLAGSRENYVDLYDNEHCEYAFGVTGEQELVAKSGDRIEGYGTRHALPRPRDEQRERTLLLLASQALEHVVLGTPCGPLFRIRGGDDELKSTDRFPDPGRAASACSALLPRLSVADAYAIEPAGDEARLVVRDEFGTVRAASAPADRPELERMWRALVSLASAEPDLDQWTEADDPPYRSELRDPEGELLLFGNGGRDFPVWSHTPDVGTEEIAPVIEEKGITSFEIGEEAGEHHFLFDHLLLPPIVSGPKYKNVEAATAAALDHREIAMSLCNHREREGGVDILDIKGVGNRIAENGQLSERFARIDSADSCAFGFELRGASDETLARHPRLYATAAEREAIIDGIIGLLDAEGMHLVEHLLLRPRVAPSYGFVLKDAAAGVLPLRSVDSSPSPEPVLEALKAMLDRVIDGEDVLRKLDELAVLDVDDLLASPATFRYRAVDGHGEVVAEPAAPFCSAEERDEALDSLRAWIEEQFHDAETRTPESLARYVRCEDLHDLLPLGGGCTGQDGSLCPINVDPYSFRATVVVPYWPTRFRQRDFRPFFERTLRLETPAHVFVRICWIDVCQMRAFETAYRRWLDALSHSSDDCDLPGAQRALVDILFRLTSVYATAHLVECKIQDDKNPMILDQTLLGTASSDHAHND